MNHVWTVASRPAGFCLRQSAWSHESSVLRGAVSSLLRRPPPVATVSSTHSGVQTWTSSRPTSIIRPRIDLTSFHEPRRRFHNASILRRLKPYKQAKGEQGLRFGGGNLAPEELGNVFGDVCPPPQSANRLLRILHGRRVDGTLDLPPPDDLKSLIEQYPEAVPDGLAWLQENFPVDEEEAIAARIRREEAAAEQENPAALMQRAEDLGLYKPQSGNYQAQLSEKEGDVFGRSLLEERHAENIAKAEKEEEELEKQIEEIRSEIQAKREQSTALTQQSEKSVEVAQEAIPYPNEYEKWILRQKNRAGSKLTLESPEVAEMTAAQRLLPSFIFVAIVTGLSYLFAQYWVPPKRSERVMHDTSLSFATCAGILATNVLIFFLWRFPPMWTTLNKYFVNAVGKPRAVSMVGNIFSHQDLKHLGLNMAWLFLLGMSLHEEVGRGTFLGIWFAGGAISSWVSLASFVSRGTLFTTSLGASGSVSAIVAAYCTIHATDTFTLGILPREWQEYVSFQGWMFLGSVMAWQLWGFLSPLKKTDYASHLAGYAVGAVAGWWWKSNQDEELLRRRRRERKGGTLFDRVLGWKWES